MTNSGSASVGETHGTSRAALERTVHRPGVLDEIKTRPGIAGKELRRQQIALETIASTTGGNEVAWRMDAALGERKNVIDSGDVEVERRGAVDAAPTAVTHHGVFNRALLVAAWRALGFLGAT